MPSNSTRLFTFRPKSGLRKPYTAAAARFRMKKATVRALVRATAAARAGSRNQPRISS